MNNPTTPATEKTTNPNSTPQNAEQNKTTPQNVGGDQKEKANDTNVVKENDVVAA